MPGLSAYDMERLAVYRFTRKLFLLAVDESERAAVERRFDKLLSAVAEGKETVDAQPMDSAASGAAEKLTRNHGFSKGDDRRRAKLIVEALDKSANPQPARKRPKRPPIEEWRPPWERNA
jgi:hypothetical protein